MRFKVGDRIRVYVPDEYNHRKTYADLHNKKGTIDNVIASDYDVVLDQNFSFGGSCKTEWLIYGGWLKKVYNWKKL